MLEGPEFRHYLSFLAVAEECNFRKAAERLRIAQPSLSAQIKQLETRIPAVLFRRTPAGVSLTRAGHLLIPYAKEMLRVREKSTRDTSAMHTGLELPLRFGFSPLVRQELMENALRGYREVVPGGTVESAGNGPEALAGLVVQGQLDAALTTLPIPQDGLRMKTVCSEAMQVCLRLDDPLANEKILTKDEVQKRLTVFFSRDAHPLFHDDLLGRFGHFGIELRPSSFVLSPSQMQSVVKANGELGLLPETTPVDAELTLRPIQGVNVRMKTGFIWSPEQQNSSFPLLIYRLIELCPRNTFLLTGKKKPPVSVGLDGATRSKRSA